MKKNRKKSNKGIFIFLAIVIFIIVVIIAIYISGKNMKYSQAELDSLAKCLTEKGTIMYGTFWCPHCAATKKRFGSSFRYIHYVECDPNGENEQSELCLEKEIDKYDTWEFADGSRVISEPTFETLAEKSGCYLPEGRNG